MKTHVLRGSKQEIAELLVRINGTIREAIVFEEDANHTTSRIEGENFFAEMEPYLVDVRDVDDSREAIYRPGDSE